MATKRLFVFSLAALIGTAAYAVTIPTVLIDKPGNAADWTGFGTVAYTYRIGTTEVTNSQYTEFLNGVAASDPYGLYNTQMASNTLGGIIRSGVEGSYTYAVKPPAIGQGPGGTDYTYENKPVVSVSWYDAIRFANWLHNGRGSGDTENGAYTLLGGTSTPSNGNSIVRNPGARWWLPNENEWYKAAYYDPQEATYHSYPMGTGAGPNNNLPSADTGNSANCLDSNGHVATLNADYPLTDAGAYILSASPFGTFDQGGNLSEWTDSMLGPSLPFRKIRGGSWGNFSDHMLSRIQNVELATQGSDLIGFRVATIVPEPSTLLLAAFGALAVLLRRRRS